MTTSHALAAALLTAATALGASACGGDGGGGSPEVSATAHNDADVQFASDMIQHHAQALALVDLTRERPLDPAVEQVAEQILAAQAPEIETFSDWLTDWDEPVPDTVRDHVHAGHGDGDLSDSMSELDDEGHQDMPGMMSADEVAALEDAADADFQARWLEMMVEHHEGAVRMAEAEQEDGRYRPAVELAGSIARSQAAEIETMRALLP